MMTDSLGRAYGRTAPTSDARLTCCGPGTPGGELLRRYWHPIARSDEVSELPRLIKVLGEELVLFRTTSGDVGLLYPRCMHRGASLLFGKIEAEGLRCCYHGWLFDVQGRCLEMPCEPSYTGDSSIRQPWYPLVERYGLVWAYLGRGDQQPDFPVYSLLEDLGPNEVIRADGSIDPPSDGSYPDHQDHSWWQYAENLMDPLHVYVLHSRINGIHFSEDWAEYPEVDFIQTRDGIINPQVRHHKDGRTSRFLCQYVFPNINASAMKRSDGRRIGTMIWSVPRDDTSYRTFVLFREAVDELPPDDPPPWGPNKNVSEWSTEDHQRWQNDYTVTKSQGDVQYHSEQHLTRFDRGIAMMRKMFLKQADIVLAGGDPIGSSPSSPYKFEIADYEE